MTHAPVETEERFVDVPGGRVFVRTWTPPAAETREPVVLLHDSLGCVDLWRDLPGAMAGRLARPIVAWDRLGFGRSSPRRGALPPGFIREEAEVHFPAVREALGLAPCPLFGYSIGGVMALTIASADPGLCTAVVSESAMTCTEERTRDGLLEARRRFAQPVQFERLARWHGDKAQWVLDSWINLWLSDDFAEWTLADEVTRIDRPVLVIHGDRDEYGSTASPETVRRLTGGAAEVAILKGCGHMPHRERPDEVLDLVARFLGER